MTSQSGSGVLSAWLEGVSLIAPGIPNWEIGAKLLGAGLPYQPAACVLPMPDMLPPAERRRASRVVKLCIGLAIQATTAAQRAPGELACVFCSSNADGHNIHAIFESLTQADRLISPTRFTNSVHNAAAANWTIAARCMLPSQALCAFDASFAAGLLEAMVQVQAERSPVLMLAYDSEYPEPLYSVRPIPDAGGIGLVLSPTKTSRAIAELRLQLGPAPLSAMPASGHHHTVAATSHQQALQDMTLANLSHYIPALEGLLVLDALINRRSTPVAVPYLPGQSIVVEVRPC
jgi:hypothetical protein